MRMPFSASTTPPAVCFILFQMIAPTRCMVCPALNHSPKLQDYAAAEFGLHTGMDPVKAAAWHDALAEAAGREDRVGSPLSGLQSRPAADNWHDLENEIQGLVPKPLREVTSEDISKAGGDLDLQERWKNYQQRPEPSGLSHEDLSPLVRAQLVPAFEDLSPNVLLNSYAHEAIVRAIAENSGEGIDRGWKGFRIDSEGARTIADSLDKMSGPGRENYKVLADQLRGLANKYPFLALARRDADATNIVVHEHVHGWQEKYPVTVPQDVLQNKDYRGAAKTLENRGYKPEHPSVPREILTHFAEGDHLGLSSARVVSLAKEFFKLYNEDQLKDFPSNNPLLLQALKELV